MDHKKNNYYQILEVSKDASTYDIETAYQLLSKEYDSQLKPGNTLYQERVKDFEEAYKILTDPVLRSDYDLFLKSGVWSQSLGNKNNVPNSNSNQPPVNTPQPTPPISPNSPNLYPIKENANYDYLNIYNQLPIPSPPVTNKTPPPVPKSIFSSCLFKGLMLIILWMIVVYILSSLKIL